MKRPPKKTKKPSGKKKPPAPKKKAEAPAPKPKRPSGGKRAGDKRRAEAEAELARPASYKKTWAARYRKLGPAPIGNAERGHQWLADVLLLDLEETIKDPGIKPEQRREQISRVAAQAVKAMDPAKLQSRITALEEALARLDSTPGEVDDDAGDEQEGPDSEAGAPAPLT